MKIINKILVLFFAILLNTNSAFSAENAVFVFSIIAKNNTKILLIIFIVSPIC